MKVSAIKPEVGMKSVPVPAKERKPRSKPEIKYRDIMGAEMSEYIESCIRFKIPSTGIHKPLVWKTRENWGAIYKVLAKVPLTKLAKNKSTKYLVCQVRWRFKRGNLVPENGYEDFAKTMDMSETNRLRDILLNME
jgi:hypothetical protein